ncbi:MAG: DUF502 domain-containing protein [Chitinophagaceae bacterium]|nr:MAG: DUF502 domain-containing protein [Chitinophagaceae bacterium]
MPFTQKALKTTSRARFRKLMRYFLQGMIILAPIFITGYAVYSLFDWIDNLLRRWVDIPGLGFVIILVFTVLVGWISSSFLMGGALSFFDQVMERTPVIKFIYSSTKDFFEAFAGDKKKFSRAVIASIFAEDVWIVGFLTDEEMAKFDMGADMVAVYVPQSYNFAGQLYLLPRSKVRMIERISSGQAMKYAVTGGVVDLEDETPVTLEEAQPPLK